MRRVALALLIVAGTWASTVGAKRPAGDPVNLYHNGKERSYFAYVPKTLDESPPLLVLLHGSGRDGSSLIRDWKALADEQGILLLAPNSADPAEWSPYQDTPALFRAMQQDFGQRHPFDPSRVFLFGHSGGAVWALQLALLGSQQYAAVAVHAGLIPPPAYPLIDQAKRKVPFLIQVGTRDPFFPLQAVRETVNTLLGKGFQVTLLEIAGHDHNYYSRSKTINQTTWDFFAQHQAN